MDSFHFFLICQLVFPKFYAIKMYYFCKSFILKQIIDLQEVAKIIPVSSGNTLHNYNTVSDPEK